MRDLTTDWSIVNTAIKILLSETDRGIKALSAAQTIAQSFNLLLPEFQAQQLLWIRSSENVRSLEKLAESQQRAIVQLQTEKIRLERENDRLKVQLGFREGAVAAATSLEQFALGGK